MGLIVPRGPDWNYYADNTGAVLSFGSRVGTVVTAGANDTPGSVVTLLSALSQDVEYIVIEYQRYASSGADSSTLLDIMIDPAGGTSWLNDPLIPGLLVGFSPDTSNSHGAMPGYQFPVWIPAGASIGARAQTAHSSDITVGRISIMVAGGNSNPASWWCGQKVTNVGVDLTNSRGTLITPGASSSFGSWTNLGSTLSVDCGAIQFARQGVGGNAVAGSFDFYKAEFGIGERLIAPPFHFMLSSLSEQRFDYNESGIVFKSIPSGAQLQCRIAGSSATPDNIDVAAYVVH